MIVGQPHTSSSSPSPGARDRQHVGAARPTSARVVGAIVGLCRSDYGIAAIRCRVELIAIAPARESPPVVPTAGRDAHTPIGIMLRVIRSPCLLGDAPPLRAQATSRRPPQQFRHQRSQKDRVCARSSAVAPSSVLHGPRSPVVAVAWWTLRRAIPRPQRAVSFEMSCESEGLLNVMRSLIGTIYEIR